MGLADCFAHFGAAGDNPRWSWSARTPDSKTVVLTVWKDLLDYSKRPAGYTDFVGTDPNVWMERPGNKERLKNLILARDQLNGLFRVVIVVAADVNAEPRKIASCHTVEWSMRLTELDESTGQFRAEMVAPSA